MIKPICLCFLAVLLLTGSGCAARSTDSGPALAQHRVIASAFPATATVLRDGQIAGAGAFVSRDGRFLTAAHVVHRPADRIELLLTDGRVVPATTIATDLGHDLAVLQATLTSPLRVEPLALFEALPEPGDRLFLIAAPSMLKETVLPGTVARHRLGFNFLGDRKSYTRTLLVAASAMPGSSGGCWINERGQIVGVQSAVAGDGKASHGLAMIAPASAATRLLKQQADQPTATLGGEFVGLYTQGYGFNKRFPKGATGVALHRLFKGSPVAQAQIPQDYLITHIDGQAVTNTDGFIALVRQRSPGDTVRLTVVAPDSHAVREASIVLGRLEWE